MHDNTRYKLVAPSRAYAGRWAALLAKVRLAVRVSRRLRSEPVGSTKPAVAAAAAAAGGGAGVGAGPADVEFAAQQAEAWQRAVHGGGLQTMAAR